MKRLFSLSSRLNPYLAPKMDNIMLNFTTHKILCMEKYFYKLVHNIDFVWKIKVQVQDPYRQGEMHFGHYVCNQRVFNPDLFENFTDFQQRGFLRDYKEIEADLVNDEHCYFDRTIGLLHTNDYWTNLHAHRHIHCLGKIVPIVFGNSEDKVTSISNKDRQRYLKLMACGPEVGQAMYNTAHDYFKSLWEFDAHFAKTKLDTLELFLPTLELQAIYLRQGKEEGTDTACVVFRPSWDPEHGLAILINLDSKEVTLYED